MEDDGNPTLSVGVWRWPAEPLPKDAWVPNATIVGSATIIDEHVDPAEAQVTVLTCGSGSLGARQRHSTNAF